MAMAKRCCSRDILLSPDQRYDVWEIKRVERPHLMDIESEEDDIEIDDDRESMINKILPLVDGCDLKGWRQSKLVQSSTVLQGYLNVGSGCSLLRRESQLPVLPSASLDRWKQLQAKLLEPPKVTAQRIIEQDAVKLSWYPWFEKENVPVILEGLTKNWKAMQTCKFDRLVNDFGDFEWRFSDTHGATMSLRSYKNYAFSIEGQLDDAPLAVYDSQLHTDERARLLEDYTVPECFSAPDLFQEILVSDSDGDDDAESTMPPFRWILIGSPRSGTGLHIDPLGTHAWVTLIEGEKR